MDGNIAARPSTPVLQRAVGNLVLSSKRSGMRTIPDRFRTSGALKALFPRHPDHLEAIVINSSGGLTGGDALSLSATAGEDSRLTMTTQAAERAYRARSGIAEVTTKLNVAPGATMHWLPQELILFDGSALKRRLHLSMAENATCLVVEPVVFGRQAMGETVTNATFFDNIHVAREGAPIYRDAVRLEGNLQETMARSAIGAGAGAMASIVYVSPGAEAHLAPVRKLLPKTGGASLRLPDMLVCRILAGDAFELRRSLLPILDRLSSGTLPKSWRL